MILGERTPAISSPRVFTGDEHRKLRESGILGEGDELVSGRVIIRGTARPWRWTWEDVVAMAAAGIISRDERVELIDGEVMVLAPIGNEHLATTGRILRVLFPMRDAFGPEYTILQEVPIRIASEYRPQADLVIIRESLDEVATRGVSPSDVRLVIEVSDSTLSIDRNAKSLDYSRVGIPEYWIVNLRDRRLEVHREPTGGGYSTLLAYKPGDSVTPVFAPKIEIAVSDILPVR
ncbi:MAG: Uma2 family endonuclease [Capsulimonadaceae bacterium]